MARYYETESNHRAAMWEMFHTGYITMKQASIYAGCSLNTLKKRCPELRGRGHSIDDVAKAFGRYDSEKTAKTRFLQKIGGYTNG